MLEKEAVGTFDGATQEALRVYQRRHMLPSAGVLDLETRDTLLADSRELDFRTLLRALRERVVDASGLVEDGSALNAWEPILGRFIDSSEYRRVLRSTPLERGAGDLISRATEAAARALGWTSPEAASRALATMPLGRVAVRLPPVPAYHAKPVRLRAEIDRGDVWTSYPFDAEGRPRPSPVKNRPTFTLFVETDAGEIPLVRWPTTIGAWKAEKLDDDGEALRYKASPVGRWYWRDLVAAPAWFPPPTTPDRELMRRGPDGRWVPDEAGVGPGYRSAYGLVALFHHRAIATSGGGIEYADIEIRTHGSANYRSILRGSSHGCHRLFNHLAIRLGNFVLASDRAHPSRADRRAVRARPPLEGKDVQVAGGIARLSLRTRLADPRRCAPRAQGAIEGDPGRSCCSWCAGRATTGSTAAHDAADLTAALERQAPLQHDRRSCARCAGVAQRLRGRRSFVRSQVVCAGVPAWNSICSPLG